MGGGTSSIPAEQAEARLTPTEQREIPKQGNPPSDCPMHNTNAAEPPSGCPMHVAASPPSGCPMHAGEGKENDIDPTNMVKLYLLS